MRKERDLGMPRPDVAGTIRDLGCLVLGLAILLLALGGCAAFIYDVVEPGQDINTCEEDYYEVYVDRGTKYDVGVREYCRRQDDSP